MSPSDPPVALLQQRQALVKQLRQLEAFILRGSLIERFKRCGKPGCKCAQGPGHGPRSEFALSMLSHRFRGSRSGHRGRIANRLAIP
jgi:hypothetical protein